ncbi:MAG: hypothetical protein KGI97_02160 [Alphaproteobacteria bacterium]|nr:hypothetical protein [Alphaproteobacteria bacterium]
MAKRILTFVMLGMLSTALSGCISGVKPPDTYVGKDGKTTIIESDREMCRRSCNDDYERCMDSTAASTNNGLSAPSGVFGASGECRSDLTDCLKSCLGR